MSHPLSRRLTQAVLLTAAGAASVVGAAGAAGAVEPSSAPDVGGLTNLDGAHLGNTVDKTAQSATDTAAQAGGNASERALPTAGKAAGSAAKTGLPAAQHLVGHTAGDAGHLVGDTTSQGGGLPSVGGVAQHLPTSGQLPTQDLRGLQGPLG